jgi:serine/alanine adding enzyme
MTSTGPSAVAAPPATRVAEPVRITEATDGDRWDAYVRSNPRSHAYHLWAWRRIIVTSFRQQPHYLQAEASTGEIRGVLPLVRLRSRLFGDFLVSLPYVNYAGPCADDEATARELVNAAVTLASNLGVQHLELRSTGPAEYGLRTRESKVAMRLPLPGSSDALWKSLPTKMRTKVRRVQQETLTARIGRLEELDAFYDVFAVNMRDLGTPVYSKRFMQTVLNELPESSWVCNVYLGDRPVAGGFLVGYGDSVEIPWGSALREFNHLRANTLLYWHMMAFVADKGYRVFDFGRSSPGSGPYDFKLQWGAQPTPLPWQYWVRGDGPLPEINPQNPRYQMAIDLWRRLPVPITRVIGPFIVRNVP